MIKKTCCALRGQKQSAAGITVTLTPLVFCYTLIPTLYFFISLFLCSVITLDGYLPTQAFGVLFYSALFLASGWERNSPSGALRGQHGPLNINVCCSAAPWAILPSASERSRLSAFEVYFSWKLQTCDYLRFLSALQSVDWSLKWEDMGLGNDFF